MKLTTAPFSPFWDRLIHRARSISMAFVAVILLTCGYIPYAHAAGGEWIRDQHGCRLWNQSPLPDESIMWSGKCIRGYGQGRGVEHWMKLPGGWQHSTRTTLRSGHSFGPYLDCAPNKCFEEYEIQDVGVGTFTSETVKSGWVACATLDPSNGHCNAGLEAVISHYSNGKFPNFREGAYQAAATPADGDFDGPGVQCRFVAPVKCWKVSFDHPAGEPNVIDVDGRRSNHNDSAAKIPDAARAEVFIQQFVSAVKHHKVRAALTIMSDYRLMTGPAEPPAVAIVEAKLAHQAGFDLRAMYVLTLYFKTHSPSDSHYQEAVDLYAKIKGEISELQQP